MTARGFVNLRDVGGLPLVGGGVTAHGVLYRGDAPYPGDSVLPALESWPPSTIIDLRGDTERDRFAYGWPTGTVVHHMPLFDSAAPGARPVDLQSLYTRMLHYNETRVGEILARVVEPDGAVLLHCTAGKDRTGVLVAVLLLAAGVEPDAVVDDYVRSEEALFDLMDRWLEVGVRTRNSPPLAEQFLRAPADAIAPIVEQLTAAPGGPAQWMLDHGANPDHLDTWRARIHRVAVPFTGSPEGQKS
ncbi:tyrosine-protein phosphatase [Rhodococcus artemisiae]|uniref:Tyrosine-protein phosphatase n=1 Tax=Rhodococcus artemisiae TaxID=714159 RepID=A0ABU7L6T7_9NOCA|nr:tyrosine-protein phosphatase [Rhodococcus artemisiae]MEE2057249.1 tyrosine-protein phosphatase [Rhodococcus artemisiae]